MAAATAADLGVTALDLRKVVPSDFEHYYDTLHFTPTGATRVAEALTEVIAGTSDANGERDVSLRSAG